MTHFKINTSGFTLIESFILATEKKECSIGYLNASNTKTAHSFHAHINSSLSTTESNFFLEKDYSYFQDHLSPDTEGEIIGAIVDGKLVAQAIIHNPEPKKPDTGMVDLQRSFNALDCTVIQGIGVLPEVRGNQLAERIAQAWLKDAHRKGKVHALAEIEIRNIASWNSLIKGGLDLIEIGIDPEDGSVLYNAHALVKDAIQKPLKTEFNHHAQKDLIFCQHTDMAQQEILFGKSYKGIAFDKKTKSIIFKKHSVS
jgi:hypothetical protein